MTRTTQVVLTALIALFVGCLTAPALQASPLHPHERSERPTLAAEYAKATCDRVTPVSKTWLKTLGSRVKGPYAAVTFYGGISRDGRNYRAYVADPGESPGGSGIAVCVRRGRVVSTGTGYPPGIPWATVIVGQTERGPYIDNCYIGD
jgi:hypothetical protein